MAHRLPAAGKPTEPTDNFMFYHVVDGQARKSKRSSRPSSQRQEEPDCSLRTKCMCAPCTQQQQKPESTKRQSCSCGKKEGKSVGRGGRQQQPQSLASYHGIMCWPKADPVTCVCQRQQQQQPGPSASCSCRQSPQKDKRKSTTCQCNQQIMQHPHQSSPMCQHNQQNTCGCQKQQQQQNGRGSRLSK